MITYAMYQITFSEQSLVEFNKLDKMAQLQFIDELSSQCEDYLQHATSNKKVQKFSREGRDIFRCRVGELRVYFEKTESDGIIFCRYILPEHSFVDFIYRTKLPITDEQISENTDSFWKYLESWIKGS